MREASPSSSSEVDDSCFMDFARRRLWIQSDSNLLSHPNANFHYLVVFDHLTANLFVQSLFIKADEIFCVNFFFKAYCRIRARSSVCSTNANSIERKL